MMLKTNPSRRALALLGSCWGVGLGVTIGSYRVGVSVSVSD